MRIALFTEVFLPKIDGITNRLSHTIRCLRDDGHEVLVFAPQGAATSHAGARVVRVPACEATAPCGAKTSTSWPSSRRHRIV